MVNVDAVKRYASYSIQSMPGEHVQPRKFTFYHADRMRSLTEGMELTLLPNGLSVFGNSYHGPDAENSTPDAIKREMIAEAARQQEPQFRNEPSRLACLFAGNSIDDAKMFAKAIEPAPAHDIPIFEIFASNFSCHDMNWLDYECPDKDMMDNAKHYWWREISISAPITGDRRPPRIEVKIALPATVGRIVSWVQFSPNI